MSLSQAQSTTNRQRGPYDLDVEAVKSPGQRHDCVAGVKAVEIGQSAQYNDRTSRCRYIRPTPGPFPSQLIPF
jgi:hypothetical protein